MLTQQEKEMKYLNRIFAWMGNDGMMHVILSSIIACLLSLVIPTGLAAVAALAAMVTLAIGIAKELYDAKSGKGCCEVKDIVCDIIGILIGIL